MSNWQRIVERCWRGARVTEEEPLAGDASTRRYVRLRLAGESVPRSIVAMLLPESDAKKSASDFVDVQRYLEGRGVAVPALHLDAATEDGILLLEDLGDEALADAAAQRAAGAALLEEAAAIAARIAASILDPERGRCVAFGRRHDRALIEREIHLIGAFAIADGDRPAKPESDPELTSALSRLGEALEAQPDVLIHRDYHAWNLYVDADGRVRTIDFQDAMIGPALYDVASLCTDRASARFVDAESEARLVDRFASELRGRGIDLDRASLRRDYFVAVAFRALRVLGRFRQLALEAGRTAHLRFVPDVAAQARRALEAIDDPAPRRLLATRSELFA